MPYSMKLALAWTQDFMWEVVQPLEGPSIYKEFLAKRGEGMHHVLIETAGHQYEDLLEEARTKGCPPGFGTAAPNGKKAGTSPSAAMSPTKTATSARSRAVNRRGRVSVMSPSA